MRMVLAINYLKSYFVSFLVNLFRNFPFSLCKVRK